MEFLNKIVYRLDPAFLFVRIFTIVPITMISWFEKNSNDSETLFYNYNLALLLSSIALFAAPQIVLHSCKMIKTSFLLIILLNSIIILCIALLCMQSDKNLFLKIYIFLVVCRSLWLYVATLQKAMQKSSKYIVFTIFTLILVFWGSMSFVYTTLLSMCLFGVFVVKTKYFNLNNQIYALKNWIAILYKHRWGFGYFQSQQVISQLAIVFYGFVAVGDQYIEAVHFNYLLIFVLIFNNLYFRHLLVDLVQNPAGEEKASSTKRNMMELVIINFVYGFVIWSTVEVIEFSIYGKVVLDDLDAVILCALMFVNGGMQILSARLIDVNKEKGLFYSALASFCVVITLFYLIEYLGNTIDFSIFIFLFSALNLSIRFILFRKVTSEKKEF